MTSNLLRRSWIAALSQLLFGSCLVVAQAAPAQDQEILKSRVLTAIRRSSLVGSPVHPYRLEATLVLYDGAGKNPQQGYLRVFRRANRSLATITFANASTKLLISPDGNYSSEEGVMPYYAPVLVRAVQTPVVFPGFDTTPAVPPKDIPSDPPLECASIAVTSSAVIVRGPEPLLHQVCLDDKSDDLRVVVDDRMEYVREDTFSFGEQRPARQVHLRLGGFVVGEAVITQLENLIPDDKTFTPSPDMKPVATAPARVPGGVIAGKVLAHESPKYPGAAKAAHIQGVVVLHAIIGKDGHITQLSVISSPDKLLSEASLKAVTKWTYEPYILNGEPTAVDTTITLIWSDPVNFGWWVGWLWFCLCSRTRRATAGAALSDD